MSDLSKLSDLVEAIYAATGDFAQWPAMMRRVSGAFGGDCAVLGVSDENQAFSAYVAPLSDPEFVASYHAHYHAISPLMPRIRQLPAGSVVTDPMVLPRETFEKSDIYNQWILPQGIRHKLYSVLHARRGRRVMLGLHSRNEFEPAKIALCRALTPHLQRSLDITLEMVGLRAERDGFAGLLDRMDAAALIVDARGRPVWLNGEARNLFGPGGALRLEAGCLAARLPSETAALRPMLGSCFGAFQGERGGRMRLSGAGGESLVATIAPVAENRSWPLSGSASALVVVRAPRPPERPDVGELRERYRLTVAEANLALRLCEGMSLAQAARVQGVQASTARTHLKRIFDKTATARQAELVRLLLLRSP